MSAEDVGATQVDRWLQALPDESAPCGPDLEYDNAVLELNQAAAGKPETQFDAGTPPDWPRVRELAESLFERTRDVRIAVQWVRAMVRTQGFAALPQGLRLLHGLLDGLWDTVHPLPDDGDPYARMNALAQLREPEGLLGDVRQSLLVQRRGIGELRVRSVEQALKLLPARDDESVPSREQVVQMLADAAAQDAALAGLPAAALAHLKALDGLLQQRAGPEGAPDLRPLQAMLNAIAGVMPAPAADGLSDAATAADDSAADAGATGAPGGNAAGGGLSGSVRSREEAMRAIDMVCEFLERTEPTSPAPLLLRRARRMISRNFLQLMKELAPDALPEVARVMGVDPDSVSLDESA